MKGNIAYALLVLGLLMAALSINVLTRTYEPLKITSRVNHEIY